MTCHGGQRNAGGQPGCGHAVTGGGWGGMDRGGELDHTVGCRSGGPATDHAAVRDRNLDPREISV